MPEAPLQTCADPRLLSAARFKLARLAAGFPLQRHGAAAIGVTAQIVSLWEMGKIEPTARYLRAMAGAYERSVGWLLGVE